MELAGHKCVGFCEWDKFALASYTSMHLLTEEQRAYLSTLPFKERQNEIRKEVYRNGEWYAADIRTVHGWTVPKADLWCFGAPCQDFSVAGARAGLDGDRSGLVREVFRILEEMEEADRPEWLLYENVKGMLSSRSGLDYLSILLEMERLGYDVEWQVFNSKDWAVPQNRERVYTLGHFRDRGRSAVFPLAPADGENCSVIAQVGHLDGFIDNPYAYRVYDPAGVGPCLTGKSGGGTEPSIVLPMTERGEAASEISIVGLIGGSRSAHGFGEDGNRVMSVTGISPTVKAHVNKDPTKVAVPIIRVSASQDGKCFQCDHVSQCLSAGHGNCPKVVCPIGCIDPQGRTERCVAPSEQVPTLRAQSHGNQPEIVLSVLNPEKETTRQNGRRMKDNGEPSFTLTAQDRHGVAVNVYDAYNKNWIGTETCGTLTAHGNASPTAAGTFCPAIPVGDEPSKEHPGIYVRLTDELIVYAIWYERYQCYIAVRKLTPKECFRLQGWTDDYFERAAFVNSNNQLYKQAGNGVTVSVVYAIGYALSETETEE